MDEKTGKITRQATYSTDSKQSLINFIMQDIRGNYNTWEYPTNIEGIRESPTVANHYYYDDMKNNRIIASYPQ
jgi:hypothetical protein